MSSGQGLNAFEHHRPGTVSVTAFGARWDLCGRSAFDWLGAAAMDLDGLYGIFPGLVADDHLDDLFELSFQGGFDKRCTLTARAAYGRAAGKDWWWALNLTRKILAAWPHVNGTMVRQGVKVKETEFADYCDAVYSLLWFNGKEEDRLKLDLELSTPPAGVRVRQSSAAKKAMLAAFAAD